MRILLPTRYRQEPNRKWPVLYLLHGCCDNYVSWTRSTDVESLSRNLDALVVMPEGGAVGFYSNWQAGPQGETFHTAELPQLLADRYHAGGAAAVAGVSIGGLGALGYAARHPGMFTAAASFSGITHSTLSADVSQGYQDLVQSEREDPVGLWGDPDADAGVWSEHNPFDLPPRLTGVKLFVSAGNGEPGPLDPDSSVADPIEAILGVENVAFASRARDLGLDIRVDLYGPGTHIWPYWERELHRAWPILTEALRRQ